MTETEARDTLIKLTSTKTDSVHQVDRAIQTAKQIGSAWLAEGINVICLYHQPQSALPYWRIVIE